MNRRKFLQTSAGIGVGLVLGNTTPLYGAIPSCGNTPPEKDLNQYLSGHRIIDAHAHPSMFHLGSNSLYVDNSSTVEQLCEFGIEASVFGAVGDYIARGLGLKYGDDFNLTTLQLSNISSYLNDITIVDRAADIPNYTATGVKPGAIIAIEGGNAFLGNPDNIDYFYIHHYVRMITLVHSAPNDHPDSLGDQMLGSDIHGGLSPVGHQALERMIQMNIIIDVAHASTNTVFQVCEIAQNAGVPVIDSHTSLRQPHYDLADWRCRRMRTLEEMEAIASTGGVVCIWPLQCITPCFDERIGISDWAREIQYMISVLGPDHVALGSDGGGGPFSRVVGYQNIKNLNELAYALADYGLSYYEIHAFMGANMVRILSQVLV